MDVLPYVIYNYKMNHLNVSEFKQKCLELVDPDKLAIEPILLTRHNRPVAMVVEPKGYFKESKLRGSVTYCLAPGEKLENITFAEEWGN